MKRNAKWITLSLTFDESVGVKWNAEHTQIESIDLDLVIPAIRAASQTLVKQSRASRRERHNEGGVLDRG